MKSRLFSIVTLLSLIISFGSVSALGQYTSGSTGVDVSWPNCSASIPITSFGIVGITGGKNFTPNNCLINESAHFGNLSLYTNTGYPGLSAGLAYKSAPKACLDSDLSCIAYNYGYNSGIYAISYAASSAVVSNSWWLDVETINTWTTDPVQNQASLQGTIDALQAAGISTVGVYSTTAQWKTITGGWQNNLPSWGATSWTNAKNAATYCHGHEFTGGPSYLMQYTPRRSLDQNVAC